VRLDGANGENSKHNPLFRGSRPLERHSKPFIHVMRDREANLRIAFFVGLALVLCIGCATTDTRETNSEAIRANLRANSRIILVAEHFEEIVQNQGNIELHGVRGEYFGLGSGAVISPDGYLITARHVVERSFSNPKLLLWALRPDREHSSPKEAKLVWESIDADLALLVVPETTAPYFRWSHRKSILARGTPVIQGGARSAFATGKVKFDEMLDEANSEFAEIYHTAKTRKGDSGGVVTDVSGNLIAINTERVAVAKTKNGLVVNGAKAIRPNFDLIMRIVEDHRRSTSVKGSVPTVDN
jgi:S1-C subfamily serine protease